MKQRVMVEIRQEDYFLLRKEGIRLSPLVRELISAYLDRSDDGRSERELQGEDARLTNEIVALEKERGLIRLELLRKDEEKKLREKENVEVLREADRMKYEAAKEHARSIVLHG